MAREYFTILGQLSTTNVGLELLEESGLFHPSVFALAEDSTKDYLKKVKCPVLALGGGKDINVDSKANLAGISESLNSRRFCKVDTDLITFGSLNHLMQPAVTGNVDEYANIETTIDRDVLFAISEWIKELK